MKQTMLGLPLTRCCFDLQNSCWECKLCIPHLGKLCLEKLFATSTQREKPLMFISKKSKPNNVSMELPKCLTSSGFLKMYVSKRHVFVPISFIHNTAEALSKICP